MFYIEVFIPCKTQQFSSVNDQVFGYLQGDMFRLYNSHHQVNVEHILGTCKVRTLWDQTCVLWLNQTIGAEVSPSWVRVDNFLQALIRARLVT